VVVEGKHKVNVGEKGDGSTATRHTTTNVVPFSFRTDKTLTEALDALSLVTIVYITMTHPDSTIGFVDRAALPSHDRHGDSWTTANGRRNEQHFAAVSCLAVLKTLAIGH
jgi:hypothetical protein